MKPQTFNSLGIDVNYLVPESVEEFDSLDKPGSCLENAIDNIVYRGCNNVFRQRMTAAVALVTGIARAVEPTGKKIKEKVKQADGTETVQEVDQVKFAETELKYFAGVLAKLDKEEVEFQSLADLIAQGAKDSEGNITPDGQDRLNAVVADLEEFFVEDTDGTKASALANIADKGVIFDPKAAERAPVQPKKVGKDFLSAADSLISAGQAETVAAKLTKTLGHEVTTDREVLGKAIQEWDAKKRAEERKQLASKLQNLVI